MLEHREHELCALTDEVLDWIESYRIPAAARLGVPAQVRLGSSAAGAGGVPGA